MGLGTVALSLMEPTLVRPKSHGRQVRPCEYCGEPTKAKVCAACTPRGRQLARLFASYEELRFIPNCPLIDDIYTVLGLQGEITLEKLKVNVVVAEPLLLIYVEKLRIRRTIRVQVRKNQRGQSHAYIKLTALGETLSRSLTIMRMENARQKAAFARIEEE